MPEFKRGDVVRVVKNIPVLRSFYKENGLLKVVEGYANCLLPNGKKKNIYN